MTQGQFLIGAIFSIGLGAAAVFVAGPVSDGCCPLTGEPLDGSAKPAMTSDCCPSESTKVTAEIKGDDCCPSEATAVKTAKTAGDSCCDSEPASDAKASAEVSAKPKVAATAGGKDACCDGEASIRK